MLFTHITPIPQVSTTTVTQLSHSTVYQNYEKPSSVASPLNYTMTTEMYHPTPTTDTNQMAPQTNRYHATISSINPPSPIHLPLLKLLRHGKRMRV
jgi:hypothetical protein